MHTSSKLDTEENRGFMSYSEGKSFSLMLFHVLFGNGNIRR